MIDLTNVSPLELAAMTRVKLNDEARASIKPGKHSISFVQKVAGEILVKEDSLRKRTSNLLGKRVLGLCLHYMGAQEKNVGPLLDLILGQAVEGNKDFLDTVEKDPRIVAALNRLDEKIAKAEKLTVRGAIIPNLIFNTVDL